MARALQRMAGGYGGMTYHAPLERRTALSTLRITTAAATLVALSLATHANADKMYWVRNVRVQRANRDGSGIEDLVTGQVGCRGITLNVDAGKMYWTDQGNTEIRRANLDGSNEDYLPYGCDYYAIALDSSAGHIYWSCDNENVIQRSDLDGGSVETLLDSANTSDSRGIALDVAGGKIYWTDTDAAFKNIQRADLDGSSPETLVSALTDPHGIALDVTAGKMYWIDTTDGTIERASLDGSSQETLISGRVTPEGISLDLAAGKVYWTEVGTSDQILRADLDGSNIESLVAINNPWAVALDATPTTVNHRSIGSYSTGVATVAGSSSTVDFGGGASLPADVQAGDGLIIDVDGTPEVFTIVSRVNDTQVTVNPASVGGHTNQDYVLQR